VGLRNGFQDQHPDPGYQNTINPQFLTTEQHAMSPPGHTQNGYFVINPAELERPDPSRLAYTFLLFLLRMLISHDRNYQTFDTKMQPLVGLKVSNLLQETPQKTDAGKNLENGR
jgi:hypothetical protein